MLLDRRDARERGPGRARRGRGHARRRRAHVRRDRRARRTGSRTGCAGSGIGRGDRVLWWSDTALEAVPVFAALAKIGAVFAPLNARASVEELAPVAAVRAAAAAARGRVAPRCCGRARARRVDIPFAADAPTPAANRRPLRRRLDERDPHVIFFTSGSTGRPKGVVLSHRANWLRTFVGATTHAGRRRHRVHVPAVPHGGLDDRDGRVARPPAGALRAHPRRRDAAATTVARHRAARLYCIPAVWARILEHGVERLRPLDARRGRHRHVGDAARAARARSRTRSRTP